jgi:uncharacterized membrane protein YdjX (TVP38/TMEM64 family)
VVYSFRSLILFPASLLTAISGLLFGPWHGILFTIIGENISGNISFVVGRYFGSGLMKHLGSKIKIIRSLECNFRKSGFLTVLTMRLMYMPFDLVGYMSGVCKIRQRDFALGTFIGTIPACIFFSCPWMGLIEVFEGKGAARQCYFGSLTYTGRSHRDARGDRLPEFSGQKAGSG